jgi:hypothetical protein
MEKMRVTAVTSALLTTALCAETSAKVKIQESTARVNEYLED